MTIDELIADIITREGGFVNIPADRGGPTKYGITQTTLAAWRGEGVAEGDVRGLTKDEATAIYYHRYVTQPGYEGLPEPIRDQVVDAGVLSGPAQATRWLQRVLGVAADGIVGPVTRGAAAALSAQDVQRLVLRFARERAIGLAKIVRDDGTQRPFLVGWITRALRPLE